MNTHIYLRGNAAGHWSENGLDVSLETRHASVGFTNYYYTGELGGGIHISARAGDVPVTEFITFTLPAEAPV